MIYWFNGFLLCWGIVMVIGSVHSYRELTMREREIQRLRELLQYKDQQISQLREAMTLQ